MLKIVHGTKENNPKMFVCFLGLFQLFLEIVNWTLYCTFCTVECYQGFTAIKGMFYLNKVGDLMEPNEQLTSLLARLTERHSTEFVLELLETLEDDEQFAEIVKAMFGDVFS